MSKKLYEENNVRDIADAIREQNGTQNSYTVAQMGNAVRAIRTQPNLETLTVTENGNYLPGANKDGFDEVAVNVPNSYTNSDEGKVVKNGALVAQTARAAAITANGTYDTTENDEVTINVSGGGSVIQSLSVTQNGTYTPPSGVNGYAPVTVNVSGGATLPTLKIIDSTVFQHYKSIASRYASSPLDPCFPAIAFKSYRDVSSVFPRLANSLFDGVSTPSFYKPSGALTGIIFLQKVDKTYNKLYIKAKSAIKVSEESSSILLAIGSSNMAFNADGWLTDAEKIVALASSDYTAEQIVAQENLSIVSSDPSLLSEQTIIYSIPSAASDYFIGLSVWNQEIYICDMYLTVE